MNRKAPYKVDWYYPNVGDYRLKATARTMRGRNAESPTRRVTINMACD